MCPLSVALHNVLLQLTVTINTIGGEPCVDVFSELPRVFCGYFHFLLREKKLFDTEPFLHWLCVSG